MKTDAQLIQAARTGDEYAFAELVSRYRPRLLAFLRRRLTQPEDAEDVTQITLLKAYRHLPQMAEPQRFSGWLWRIARNESVRWQRRQVEFCSWEDLTPEEAGEACAMHGSAASPEAVVLRQETVSAIHREIAALPAPDRAVAEAFYLDDLSYAEIEARHALSHSALASRLHRIRQRLRSRLQKVLLWWASLWAAKAATSTLAGEVITMSTFPAKKMLTVALLATVATVGGHVPAPGPGPATRLRPAALSVAQAAPAPEATPSPVASQPSPRVVPKGNWEIRKLGNLAPALRVGCPVAQLPSCPVAQLPNGLSAPAQAPAASPAPGPARPPIPHDHWMYQAFQDLRQAGLLADYPPGAAEPDVTRDDLGRAVARYGRAVTRPGAGPTPLDTAQARRVWRLINSLRHELRAAGFTDFDGVKQHLLPRALPPDVPPDHWAAQEVAELFAEGILEGYPGGTFEKPEAKAEAKPDKKATQRPRGQRFSDVH